MKHHRKFKRRQLLVTGSLLAASLFFGPSRAALAANLTGSTTNHITTEIDLADEETRMYPLETDADLAEWREDLLDVGASSAQIHKLTVQRRR